MTGSEEAFASADGTDEAWPPPGGDAWDTAGLYARLADRGFQYGETFRGLRAAWSSGEDIYADVEVGAPASSPKPEAFHVHPALLDAALHAALGPLLDGEEGLFLPFALRRVRVHHSGAKSLRVHITPDGDKSVSLSAVDAAGNAVVSVGSVALRPVSSAQLAAAAGRNGRLLRLEWTHLPRRQSLRTEDAHWAFLGTDHLGLTGALKSAKRPFASYQTLRSLDAGLRGGEPVPDVLVVSCTDDFDGAGSVRSAAQRALILVQEWLRDDRFASSRLVFVTQGAIAAKPADDCADLPGAALWGLVRSAQTEHPRRFVLVDVDETESWGPAFVSAVATGAPQVAIRGGALLRPRLAHCPPAATARPVKWDTNGTVLITGGTGALGASTARHLVRRHHVSRLVLLSRRGPAAPGARELAEELTALGAHVRIAAGDAGDPADLARVLAGIPAEHRLTAVLHTAGVVADGTVTGLTPRALARVFRPKVDAALNLHRLTQDLPDCELVLFSSISGLLGGAGQGNYAAANAFLDGLAQHRRVLGLRGTALAWGPWADGMAGGLAAADLDRMARQGLAPMPSEEGLGLLDAGRARDEPVLVPVRLDEAALSAGTSALPELMADLATRPVGRASSVRADDAAAFRAGLVELSADAWEPAIVEFVRTQVASALGHASADAVEADRDLVELGFDSLTSLELGRRLSAAAGLRLPATLPFDHPTPAALGRHLAGLLR
uniref:Type I polyketide synthase n=1 Tax=Streptomyces sp. MJ635-86F5 TaxID=1321967 RepID=X5IY86_9ACTN|nr:type I polyketide synthase [Streptomyces sp. MJ635-86F5]